MIKRKFLSAVAKFKEMSPTAQGLIILCIVLIIGIILRWEYISTEIARGFNFFGDK